MRAVSIWVAQCVAGLVTFSCFGDADEDDGDTDTGGRGGVSPTGGSGGISATGGITASGGDQTTTGGVQGVPEACCRDGITSTCYCNAGVSCNFGWFVEFYPDGTCCQSDVDECTNGGAGGGGRGGSGGGGSGGVAGQAGSGGEAGGQWESCCEDGITDQCFCDGGFVCNFGADVEFFADGTCCNYYFDDQEGPHSCSAGGAGGGAGTGGGSGAVGVGGAAGSTP